MLYERLKKAIVSLALVAGFVLSAGIANSSTTQASAAELRGPNPAAQRRGQWDRREEREWMQRIRRLDRDRRVRYRYNRNIRVVGYMDRFGRFHAIGFYDRFGRFHRY